MRRLFLILSFLAIGTVASSEGAATIAQEASISLLKAADQLAASETAKDRVKALTETVRAYEDGLAAMREGLRLVSLEEGRIAARLQVEDKELGAYLSVLQRISRIGGDFPVSHPGKSVDAIRAGVLSASLVPALEEKTSALARDVADARALRKVRESGVAQLQVALDEVRKARSSLSESLSERKTALDSTATDDAALQALLNSSDTLSAFADSLMASKSDLVLPDRTWSMPVRGRVLRGFNEADAAGVRRPGWTIGADESALVTSPSDATVRFSGQIDGVGEVVILEPSASTLVILAGHEESYVSSGEIVSKNDPIALMRGAHASVQEKLNKTALLGGQLREETLYIEVRQGQSPVNPSAYIPQP